MNFANVRNEQIIDMNSNYLDADIINVEVTDSIYDIWKNDKNTVVYKDGEVIIDPDYKEKQEQAERERLAMLNMTGADVERAIYKVKGIDFDDILAMVKDNPAIDEKALKIEFKANNFFRGNPYIEQVGALLGFTSDMLDRFFDTKDYHELIAKEGENENTTDTTTDIQNEVEANPSKSDETDTDILE